MLPKNNKLITTIIISMVLLFVVFGFAGDVFAQSYSGLGEANKIADKCSEYEEGSEDYKRCVKEVSSPSIVSTQDTIANIIGWILFYIATFFGWFVQFMIVIMVDVANYNHFLDNEIVIRGWTIVREIANNFFIIILLTIAVGTILRIPNYNRQLLPKLLIMAILINFSKMFTGIFIDFAQVVMLFFANFIRDVGGQGNIILVALGLDDLYRISQGGGFEGVDWSEPIPGLGGESVIKTMLFALILSVVAFVVIAMITIILVYRIVMLWFLVILSPLAYILTTFPKGQQYAGMWWGELTKNLVMGPVMMFFLYLSFFSGAVDIKDPASSSGVGAGEEYNIPISAISSADLENRTYDSNVVGTRVAKSLGLSKKMEDGESFWNFLIIIGLMVGSLIAGQKVGGAGSQWAGKGVSTLSKWGKKVPAGIVGGAKTIGRETDDLVGLRKGVTAGAYRRFGLGRIPFVGTAVGKKVGALGEGTAKRQSEKINAAANAFKGRSNDELRRVAKSKSVGEGYNRIAATQALAKKGLLKDDKNLNENERKDRIDIINQARKDLQSSPELLKSFDENIRKNSSGLALSSSMYTKDGKINSSKIESDMRSGDLNIGKALSNADSKVIEALKEATGGKDDSIAKFLQSNADKKGFSDAIGALNKGVKKQILDGVNVDTFKKVDKEGNAIGPVDEDARGNYLSATKQSGFTKMFDDSAEEKENYRKHFEKNRKDIRENIGDSEIESLVENVGTDLNADDIKAIKSRSTEHKNKLGDAIQDQISTMDPEAMGDDIAKLMKKAISAGIKEVSFEGGTNEQNEMRKQIYGDRVASELSANDLKSGKFSNEQLGVVASSGNLSAVKSFYMDPGNNVGTASRLADIMREQKRNADKGIAGLDKERYEKFKDFL